MLLADPSTKIAAPLPDTRGADPSAPERRDPGNRLERRAAKARRRRGPAAVVNPLACTARTPPQRV